MILAPARRRRRFRAVVRVNGVSAADLPVYICVIRATPSPPPPPPHALVVAASSRVHDFIPTFRGPQRPRGRNEHVIVN